MLFVEASEKCTIDGEKFNEVVIERMEQLSSRRYTHECIVSTKHVVVERGALPWTATKGNILLPGSGSLLCCVVLSDSLWIHPGNFLLTTTYC